MANPVAFIVLLTHTCSTFLFLPMGQSWGSHAFSPVQKCQFPLQRKLSIVKTGCWQIQNQPNTTTKRRHLPKKHIGKKPIIMTFTVNQRAEVTMAGLSDNTVNAAPSSVSISSSFYIINVGTSTPITTPQPKPLTRPGSASTIMIALWRRPGHLLIWAR